MSTNAPGKPRRVGFIGLGDQGLPMAAAVAAAGFELHVWARRPGSLDGLIAAGTPHTAHHSPADLAAACDLVALCVSTDADTAAVSEQLLPAMHPGTVLVDHGTGTPAHALALAERAATYAVDVLDAPVSGGRPGAATGTLTVFAGGPATALQHARPVLDSFSSEVVHLGGSGTGQAAKLINNTLLALNQAAVADVLELATSLRIDARALAEALARGSGSSRALSLFGTMITSATVQHLTAVQSLDMNIFDQAVGDAGLDPTPLSARARSGVDRMAHVVASLGA